MVWAWHACSSQTDSTALRPTPQGGRTRRRPRSRGGKARDHLTYLASPYSHPDPEVREGRYRAACAVAAVLCARGDNGLLGRRPWARDRAVGLAARSIWLPVRFVDPCGMPVQVVP